MQLDTYLRRVSNSKLKDIYNELLYWRTYNMFHTHNLSNHAFWKLCEDYKNQYTPAQLSSLVVCEIAKRWARG